LNQAETAVTVLAPLEKSSSTNPDLEYALGTALLRSGKPREGVTRIEKVAELQRSADAYMLAGRTLLDLDENDRARHDLEAALSLDPNLPGIQTLAGKARDKTGDKPAAEAAFRDALRINPEDFDANLYLGAILEERALKLKPTDSMARYESAMLDSMMGHYDIAAEQLERLTKDDPNWLEPHVQLAALYYKLHRAEDGAKQRQIVDRMTAEQQEKGPGKP
jgi:tetratricopeptide (TPR) repeat protein